MKVRITGHTRGLGKSLYNHFKALGHDVKGYSLSTGYDINSQEDRQKIIAECKNADVFINNAWSEYYGQTKMLIDIIACWEGDKTKRLCNISSKASFNATDINEDLERYGANKREQNKIIEDRIRIYGPHILNVILGCTDTRLSEDLEGDKLNPDDVSKWIVDMLLCDNMYFQSVTIDAKQLNYKSKQ
jgi:nucleoside-diphosphate-sugar epimerase